MQSRSEALPSVNQGTSAHGFEFYRDHYDHLVFVLLLSILAMLCIVGVVLYQVLNRPLPEFEAHTGNGQRMVLVANDEPNLLPNTLLKWASKAAVAAYTFAFVNYNDQIAAARPYFTDAGWIDYQGSINGLIQTITQKQLIVNSVVAGPPVISNQGNLPGMDYAWRTQMPFLVTYQSADTASKKSFTVLLTIVKVPTWENPQAIGIDQFVMM